MFIYDKDKNITVFTRGKNGTTNLHNHYWMKHDNTDVGSYTDFDQSKWLFANPYPAVEDMTRGCVNQDNKIFNHASPTLDNYKDGNRRVGLYIWEYITFIRTCKFVGLGTKHFLVTRDPIERLASGLNTALHNTPDDEAQRVCGISFDNLNENFKGGMPDNINDGWCNTLCCNILKLLSSQYHAQGWLCHIDKHIDFEDYEIFSVDVNNLVPFAKEVLNLDIKETDKHLPDNQWHGAHTGTRPPNKRYFHNFLDIWLQENYNNNTLDKQLSNLIDAEYKVIDKLTQINYDINT